MDSILLQSIFLKIFLDLDSKVALLLLVTAIPYNAFFVIVVIFAAENLGFSWIFVGAYILAAFVQVNNSLIVIQICFLNCNWWNSDDHDATVRYNFQFLY